MRLPLYRLLLAIAADADLTQQAPVQEPPLPPFDLSYLRGPGRHEPRAYEPAGDRYVPSATPAHGVRPSIGRPPYLPRRSCR